MPQIVDGKPAKPHLKTLDVNLIGAIYSQRSSSLQYPEPLRCLPPTATQLALHYLPKTPNPASPLKYVVLLGFLGGFDFVIDTPLTAIMYPGSFVGRTS